ncbi:putative licABCH operon regulator [Lentibacillus populi]|uniref:LicABCH operon regulator n=2 Tax=Lentibacillus populi TaxID=1827502 RepID=A0A9W5X5W0_9BACI|nr:BglG family transcription antiterminator [Lentibacillus populi]GGB43290.1 putative licABCH operon regulator [Lentibacillus populi]
MNLLSKRQKDIVLLLSRIKHPITSEWMAKELGVSDRTIRNDIKQIQRDSESVGFSVQSIRGKGYLLHIRSQEHFMPSHQQLTSENDVISGHFANQNNRVLYILGRLLLEKNFIKLETFTNEVFVSMSTIHNDIKIGKELLEKYHLKLTNRPHYGSKVEGDEYMKRLCLSNLLISRGQDAFHKSESLQLIDQEAFANIKEILIKRVNQYQIDMSDISLENLATHIAIACKRIEKGFFIDKSDDVLTDDEYPFEKNVAKEIIKDVENYTGLTFPNTETDYIIVHLLGTKLLRKKELIEFSEFDEVGTIVNCMLERLRTELNWDLSMDDEFIQAITLHIRPAMNRLRYKMNIRNPLLNDIKKKYPTAFEGAIIASKCIEEYLQIEVIEHEIAYIALHIVVALERMESERKKKKKVIIVCATGVGSARLLYYRLKKFFEQEIEIMDTINYYNLASHDLSTIDLIISTIPIQENFKIPVQIVNTFLERKDIDSIKKSISENENEIETYLQPSRIFLQQDLLDKESVIKFLCGELYKQKLVQKDYVDLVLKREAAAPTSFGNLVAVPHPITPVTNKTFWTVCTLQQPIQWYDQQMVQFICLLNIKKGSQGDLDRMFKKLISITENKSLIQKLIESNTVEELIETLKNDIT